MQPSATCCRSCFLISGSLSIGSSSIIHHQGKSDLERSYPRKMKEWREKDVRFIILRDNDGSDCLVLKKGLSPRFSTLRRSIWCVLSVKNSRAGFLGIWPRLWLPIQRLPGIDNSKGCRGAIQINWRMPLI